MKKLIGFITTLAGLIMIASLAMQWGNWRCWIWPSSVTGAANEVVANFTTPEPAVYVSQYDDAQDYADDSRTVIKPNGSVYQVEPIKQSDVEYSWQSSIMPAFDTCLAGETVGRQTFFWTALVSLLILTLALVLKLIGAFRRSIRRRHE